MRCFLFVLCLLFLSSCIATRVGYRVHVREHGRGNEHVSWIEQHINWKDLLRADERKDRDLREGK